MKQATAVYYIQGQEQIKRIDQEARQTRYNYFKEFRESLCDLFDWQDFEYYAEMTGLKAITLRKIAKYSTDPDYRKPARNIDFRYQFWRDHGHSITKPNPLFS